MCFALDIFASQIRYVPLGLDIFPLQGNVKEVGYAIRHPTVFVFKIVKKYLPLIRRGGSPCPPEISKNIIISHG